MSLVGCVKYGGIVIYHLFCSLEIIVSTLGHSVDESEFPGIENKAI